MIESIIDQDEIKKITGYKKPAKQLEWLKKNGYIEARLNAKNQIVLSSLYFHQMSGAKLEPAQYEKNQNIFDAEALNELMLEK